MSITARWHPPPIGIPAKIWAPTLVASPPKWHHRQKWTSPSSMKSTHEPCLNRLIRPTWRIPPMRIPSPSQQGLTLRHRNVLSVDRTAGATINGYHHPLASPPEQMKKQKLSITVAANLHCEEVFVLGLWFLAGSASMTFHGAIVALESLLILGWRIWMSIHIMVQAWFALGATSSPWTWWTFGRP